MVTGLLLLLALSFAMSSQAAKTTGEERIALMRPICGENARENGCVVCPSETDFHTDHLDLQSVFFGHFRSPDAHNAAVAFTGCESHGDGLGGAYLLTREHGEWHKTGFYPGWIVASPSQKLTTADGRQLLVCQGSDQHQGVGWNFLSLLDFQRDLEGSGPTFFFGVQDSLQGCTRMGDSASSPVVSGEIESVSVKPTEITVRARLGQAVLTDAQLESCNSAVGNSNAASLIPKIETVVKTRRFRFDGYMLEPEPGNPPTKQGRAIPE